MTVQQAYLYVSDRLNNLSTNANQKITPRQFVFSYNKVQEHWYDERLRVLESDLTRTEELQKYLDTYKAPLNVINEGKSSQALEFSLPENYKHFSRIYGICGDCGLEVQGFIKEVGRVGRLLMDDFWKPCLEWEETIATLQNDKIQFYTGDFSCSELFLVYYRQLNPIDMEGIDFEGYGTNVDPELDGSDLYEVLDLTALLISGDTQNPAYQALTNFISKYN